MDFFKNKKYLCYLFILVSCLKPVWGYSQSYQIQTYTENSGLSNSMVYDVAQDSSGQMWFATRAGISEYDGTGWKTHTVKDGLPCLAYSKLTIDHKNTLWALGQAPTLNVSYLHGENWISLPIGKLLISNEVFTAFEVLQTNNRLEVIVGTSNSGVYIYSNKQWKNISINDGLPDVQVNGICVWDDQFYIATSNGLAIIKDQSVTTQVNAKLNLPTGKIWGIAIEKAADGKADATAKIWLQGENWAGYIQQNKFHLVSQSTEIQFDYKYHYLYLQPDYQGGLFYGNPYAIYHLKNKTGLAEHLGRQSGLVTEGATALFIDREKNLWLTTFRGVTKITSLRFRNYHKVDGLFNNEVTAILEVAPGKLLLGHDDGLTLYDETHSRFETIPLDKYPNVKHIRVLDLNIDPQHNVWAAVSGLGLLKLNRQGQILKLYNAKDGLIPPVKSIIIEQTGAILAADRKGLGRFRNGKFQTIQNPGESNIYIRKLIMAPDNTIYMTTSRKGIYAYKNKKWLRHYLAGEKNGNSVYTMLFDSKGRIWVGTLDGLYTIKDNRLVKYSSDIFQIQRPVYLIFEDSQSRIWFGTDNGVIRWDGVRKRHYTIHNGFAGQEVNLAARLVDRKGQVWIGSDLGLSCYQEEFDYTIKDIPPPKLDFISLSIADQKYAIDQPVRFGYLENDLVFNFKAVSLIDENSIYYRNWLEGFDEEWGNRFRSLDQKIRYTNVSPGRYRFHIQAQNSLGRWSPVVSSAEIIIKKPFWLRWWFFILSGLLLISILFTIFRYLSEKRYSAQLEDLVNQRTFQLQDSETQYRTTINSLRDIIYRVIKFTHVATIYSA